MSKQALEEIVFNLFEELLNLRFHPGSGNLRGDGDLGPRSFEREDKVQLGFECKDNARKAHTVPSADWEKAKTQIQRRGLDPVFVTRNSDNEVLVHMDISLLKLLLEIIHEKT